MIWLVLLMVLSLALGIILKQVNTDKRQRLIYVSVMFTLMALLSGLRGISVGLDTANYFEIFCAVRDEGLQTTSSGHYESGFILYIYLISRIFHSPTAFMLISEALICTAIAVTVYRYSEDVVMSTFVFIVWFYAGIFNIMRQYMALAIVLLGLGFIFKKKPIKFLLTVILAASIHRTAIFFALFAVFAFKRVRISKKAITAIGILMIFAISQFENILNIFIAVFPRYEDLLLTEEYVKSTKLDLLWIIFFSFCAVVTVLYNRRERLICISSMNKKISFTSHTNVKNLFLLLFTISIFCMIMTSKMWMVTRINSYFRFSFCIIIPYVIEYLCYIFRATVPISANKQKICIIAVYSLFYCAMFCYGCYMFVQDGHGILPYTL